MADATDAEIDAALARGQEARLRGPRAVGVHYDRASGRVVVELTNGCTFAFPARQAQGLEEATDSQLAAVELLGTGYGLRWDELDADLSVPGLLAGLFGTASWMAGRAGRATSPAKAAAARANGARGGRPRKAARGQRVSPAVAAPAPAGEAQVSAPLATGGTDVPGLLDIWSRSAPHAPKSETDVGRLLVEPLLQALGYDPEDVVTKYQVPSGEGRQGRKSEADFVVFDGLARDRAAPLFVVEAKEPGESLDEAAEQGEAYRYASATRAPVVVVTDGRELRVWRLQPTMGIDRVLSVPIDQLAHYRRALEALLSKAALRAKRKSLAHNKTRDASGRGGAYPRAEPERVGGPFHKTDIEGLNRMHTVRFFPIGNADSCLIELENGRRALFDFADMREGDDADDKRCDLEKELRDCLGRDKEIDVVAFTHLDTDHCKRAKEVFHLEHAEKYQGGDRIKIKTMWVPASAVLEEGVTGQARTLRAEARHRFLEGKGIRVFSHPDALDEFLKDRKIDPAKRRNLITDAGDLCPEFNLEHDGVEFFAHSPFAEHCDGELIVRNDSALFVQATFEDVGRQTKLILSADVPYETIDDIVRITRFHENEKRLEWDIINVPHHSSYKSLGPEKGDEETKPTENLRWLYEEQGRPFGILVSTSDPIPGDDTTQPPHRQTAAYYQRVAKKLGGQFVVTMAHPTPGKPKPLIIEIGSHGCAVRKLAGGPAAVISSAAPRAG